MRFRSTLLTAVALVAAACTDAPAPTSLDASARLGDAPTCRPTEVTGLVTTLYAPQHRGETLQRFQRARVLAQRGQVEEAWPEFLALAADAVARQLAGSLLDPDGPLNAAQGAAALADQFYVCGGRDPIGTELADVLENGVDVAIAPVAPNEPTQVVVPSKNFGVADEDGDFFDESALLIIERVPDDPPFVPQTYVEHPPRYQVRVLPTSAQANFGRTPGQGDPTILVVICPGEGHPEPLDRLDILRIPDAFPAEPAQLLGATPVHGHGVTCTDAGEFPAPQQVGAASAGGRMLAALRRGASTALGWLAPQQAYAVDGGIGGETFFFSSFVAVSDPVPSSDVVVLNDVNVFDDVSMQTEGNRQFVRNLVSHAGDGPRGMATGVLFDRGRDAPCFVNPFEVCRDDKITTFRAEIAALGFSLTTYDDVRSYATVPAGIRTIFLVNPRVAFAATDVAGLRAFANDGGRIVVVGEHAAFYGETGFAVENALLSALGAGITAVPAQLDCGPNTLPASSILPHQTTAGVTSLAVACMSAVAPTGGDIVTLRNVDGTRIVGGVGVLGAPPVVARRDGGAAAPSVRREARASTTAPALDSRGNPVVPR